MVSRVAYYFASVAVIAMHITIFVVKGQPSVDGVLRCENGSFSISTEAEIQQLLVEAIRRQQIDEVHELINESLQDAKNQLNAVTDGFLEGATSIFCDMSLRASFDQVKNQQAKAMRSIEAATQLLQHEDVTINNQTQNSLKLVIGGVPVQLKIGVDLGDGVFLLPSINNWIILTHRFDGSLDFNRSWTDYRNGFGETLRGEFWLGNEEVHSLTNRAMYKLRIELYIGGTWYYAEYSTFSIDSESNKYTLRVSGFSGNAGDSLRDTALWGTVNLNGMGFTTNDADNDRWSDGNCAQDHGGGWWFNYCQYACFTCRYNDIFRWQSLSHLSTEGLRAARMMIQTK